MIDLYTKVGRRIFKHDGQAFFQYPGGEWDMKFQSGYFTGREIAVITGTVDADDYIMLQTWARVVIDQGGSGTIILPYLPGARADRGVTEGGSLYAAMVNAAMFRVITVDPHSQAAVNFYNNIFVADCDETIAKAFKTEYDGVIAPDKGAKQRAAAMADQLGVPVLEAEKTRDFASGKLTGFKSPKFDIEGDYLIVDDICDGGGTFLGLATQMHEDGFEGSLELFVTHGIFSQGLDKLNDVFERVYTTDSVPTDHLYPQRPTVIPVLQDLFELV